MPPLTKTETFDFFAQHVSSGKAAFFQNAGIDFVMGRREGPFIWDLDGATRLVNCHCNGGVYNLGHRHPELVQTLVDSLQTLDIGNHHLVSAPRAALASRLAELTGLPYTVFAVGGGEAIDLAIKVARGATGRSKIISASGGYHGHTGYALHTGDNKYFAPFGPRLPGFVQVSFGDAGALAAAVDGDTAALILETVPATLGMPIPPPGYLAQARTLCDQFGALLILDEIQAGLGRTGRLWAFEHFGVRPDMLVIGKGLSGGLYPMAATCLRADLEAVFHDDPFIHISTFGGAEVACPLALHVSPIRHGLCRSAPPLSAVIDGPAPVGADDGHRDGASIVRSAVQQGCLRPRLSLGLRLQRHSRGSVPAAADHRPGAGGRAAGAGGRGAGPGGRHVRL